MEVNFTLGEIGSTAEGFLGLLQVHRTVALHGPMGAGKTTFIHALCDALGVKDAVSSPTFSIINQYQSSAGEPVYHIDLYRLESEEEAMQAGVEDCLYSSDYCFVEWPEKAPQLFPPGTVHAQLSVVNNHTRKLTINL